MIRVRERGSAGGHQGLASIIAALGTEEFVRVRLGIQPATPVADLGDYVLEPMGRAEAEISRAMVREAAEAVRMILREGVKRAMNRFNRRASVDHPPDGEDRRK
jgi:PTH1 family peptidyl-tRNA hydrolase